MASTHPCTIKDCNNLIHGYSYCWKHYRAYKIYGNPSYLKEPKHGGKKLPEYSIWSIMKERCYNKNNKKYSYYGGRGIVVCDRWLHSFPNFLKDMGHRPPGRYSIDRIDNNGNYDPYNCRWATPTEQARNRRSARMITVKGKTQHLCDWLEQTGISRTTFYRHTKEMTAEEYLTKAF